MLIWEILERRTKRKRKSSTTDSKTDWERNLTRMRSRKRRFDTEKPVKPVPPA